MGWCVEYQEEENKSETKTQEESEEGSSEIRRTWKCWSRHIINESTEIGKRRGHMCVGKLARSRGMGSGGHRRGVKTAPTTPEIQIHSNPSLSVSTSTADGMWTWTYSLKSQSKPASGFHIRLAKNPAKVWFYPITVPSSSFIFVVDRDAHPSVVGSSEQWVTILSRTCR